jgi:hypothetical protein
MLRLASGRSKRPAASRLVRYRAAPGHLMPYLRARCLPGRFAHIFIFFVDN